MRSAGTCTPRLGIGPSPRGIAQAQGDRQLSSFQLMTGTALVVTPDGMVTRSDGRGDRGVLDVAPDILRELMKDAQAMTAGTILLMCDNTLYATPGSAPAGRNHAVLDDRVFAAW